MFYKVRVKKNPKAQSGLEVKMRAGLGFNANQLSWPVMAGEFSEPEIQERQTLQPVDEDEANLEAELGETAVTDLSGDGIPEHYKIGGKRHYDGGTPLNLPDNSFIFSRDRTMKIKDKQILEQFGITNVPMGGITPADIAKKFNINKYKKVLLDKNSDEMARKTAEMMIANYNLKLGMLAFVQESMKGFPGGIPYIAAPYLESVGIDPEEVLNKQPQAEREQPDADMDEARYGGDYYFVEGGPKAGQTEVEVTARWVPEYNKYMFEYTLPNGKRMLQSANPYYSQNGDGRTAEQYYNEEIKSKVPKQNSLQTPTQAKAQAQRTGVIPPPNKPLIKPPLAKGDATSDFDPRLGEYNDAYYDLVEKLNTDPKVKKAIHDNYRARIIANKTMNQQQKDELLAKGEEEVIKNLLDYQKQNYIIRAYDNANGNTLLQDRIWDRTAGGLRNAKYKQVLKELDFKDDEIFGDEKIRMAQASFAGLVDVANSDEHKEYFKDYQATTGGPAQLTVYDKDNPLLSDIDTIYGNNTASAIFMARTPKKSEEVKKAEETPDPQGLKPKEVKQEFKYDADTPFWLQDIIKTQGAFGDLMRVKKYMPWQATPSVDFMEPTFMSPERELAANAEQLAIGSQGLGQFTGPQAYNARFSQLAGQAAANAADVLGKYNNINVGLANEAEKFNVETYNKYAETKAANATNLFDKITIANQNYDNSKAQARQQLRQSYIDAVTNRAQTDVLNTMYPQYAVNPLTGGTSIFRNPKEMKATQPTDQIDQLSTWMGRKPGYYDNKDWANLFWQNQGIDVGSGKKKSTSTDDDDETYATPNPGYKAGTPQTSSTGYTLTPEEYALWVQQQKSRQ